MNFEIFVLHFMYILCLTTCIRNNSEATRILKLLSSDNYNSEETPQWAEEKPTVLNASIYVEGMSSQNIKDMIFKMDFYLTLTWVDSRLVHTDHNGVVLTTVGHLNQIWIPDIYFVNARTSFIQNVLKPNRYIHIRSNGRVSYNIRIGLRVSCGFKLDSFPFDKQECDLKMMSYSGNTSHIILNWRSANSVDFNPQIELPQMELLGWASNASIEKYAKTYDHDDTFVVSEHSCLILKIRLQRLPAHYISTAFVPSTIVVIISWFSFWIEPQATPARVTLCFTSFLTLTTALVASSAVLPPVSYFTALGVWRDACVLFVFGSLIEFAIVYDLSSRAKQLNVFRESMDESDGLILHNNTINLRYQKLLAASKWIDEKSRILFPVAFCVFVACYAIIYSI